MDIIEKLTEKQINPNVPQFRVGNTVVVGYKINDKRNGKDITRVQEFEGVVIARKGKGISETFTVRSNKYGVGVERIFPINCPNIDYIKVVKTGKARRAKLYFLRDRKSQYKFKEGK